MCGIIVTDWFCKCSNPDCEKRKKDGSDTAPGHFWELEDRKAYDWCDDYIPRLELGSNSYVYNYPDCPNNKLVVEDIRFRKELCPECQKNGCLAKLQYALDDEIWRPTVGGLNATERRQLAELRRSASAETIRPGKSGSGSAGKSGSNSGGKSGSSSAGKSGSSSAGKSRSSSAAKSESGSAMDSGSATTGGPGWI